MNRTKIYTGVWAALGMLVLILDGQTAFSGAKEGIELCIRTVIPSLFPFFLLSIMLTGSLSGMNYPMLRPLSVLFGTPAGTETLLLTAFLGGYPVGAQCISQAYRDGQISKHQAEHMLCFCNNAGPSFIFGMIAMQFSSPWYGWLIWLIQIFSAAAVAHCLPQCREPVNPMTETTSLSLTDALARTIKIMANVCGWVTVFRVILAFLQRWIFWLFPQSLLVFVTGILELANGCCRLSELENDGIRLIVSSIMLSLGGVCVFMQTCSVIGNLSKKAYIFGKCLQACFAFPLALLMHLMISGTFLIPIIMIFPWFAWMKLFIPYFLRKTQKRGSLSLETVV